MHNTTLRDLGEIRQPAPLRETLCPHRDQGPFVTLPDITIEDELAVDALPAITLLVITLNHDLAVNSTNGQFSVNTMNSDWPSSRCSSSR